MKQTIKELHERLRILASDLGGPILGIDSSGPVSSICVVHNEDADGVDEAFFPARVLPSDSLPEAIAEHVHFAPLRAKAIVIGIGPGSLTGLRVSLALVKGLALGASLPVFDVSSLRVLAASSGGATLVATVLNAQRGMVFSALYRLNGSLSVEPVLVDALREPDAFIDELEKVASRELVHVISDVDELGGKVYPLPKPSMAWGIALVEKRIRSMDAVDLHSLLPNYCREPFTHRSG